MILKSCNTCIIYGSDSDVVVRARVKTVDDKITLHFDDNNELGTKTDRLQVDFCDSQVGYIKTFCELEIRKNEDPYVLEPWTADCKILEMIQVLQRQKELRVRMVKEVNFISLKHGRFSGVIQNISVGGLYMTTKTRLDLDEEFEFEYCFMKKNQEVRAKILRETIIRENHYGYGCQFVDQSKGAERDIRQYVYRQQLNKAW